MELFRRIFSEQTKVSKKEQTKIFFQCLRWQLHRRIRISQTRVLPSFYLLLKKPKRLKYKNCAMAIVIESEKSGRYLSQRDTFLFRIYFFILLRSPLKKDAENKQNLSPKFFFTKILVLLTYSYSRILDTVFTKLSLTLVYDQTQNMKSEK